MEVKNLPEVASEGAVFTINGVEHVFFAPEITELYCARCPFVHCVRSECVPCNEAEGSAEFGIMPLTLFVTRALDKD